MAEIIRMPRMSDTMEEGIIVEWHKKVGDSISIGELLAEIETDKATMDFESPKAGVLLHIGAEKGQAVPIDGLLAVIGEKGEDFKELLKGKTPKTVKQEGKKDSKEHGKEAPETAVVKRESSEEGSAPSETKKEESSTSGNGRIKASPLAKRLAEEKGVSLKGLKGTGDEGRIVKRDIEAFISKTPSRGPVQPAFAGKESFEEVPLTQMRKTIAKRLAASKFSAPHFYLTIEILMDKAIDARKDINEVLPVKVSFNDLILKAAAMALRKNPNVNASWMDDKIRINHHIHIGIAVAIDQGLIVPVLRFADGKSIGQISSEAQQLVEKAKSGALKLDELQGNTFTVSNLGMFDIDEFTAIINSPESAILAVGKIKEAPVVKDGEVKISNVMKVTMSCDHRVVDGATGAKFLQTFKKYLENPISMLV